MDRARRLLLEHHGGGGRQGSPRGVSDSKSAAVAMASQRTGWTTLDGYPEVLRGPKGPAWTCSKCATEGNWACRIGCRQCGPAPASTRRREAIARHKETLAKETAAAETKPRASQARDGWRIRRPPIVHRVWAGAWPREPSQSYGGSGQTSAAEPTAKTFSKVEKCLALLRAAEQAEAGEVMVEGARKQLEAARAERDSAVPPEKARAWLEQKIREQRSKADKAREAEARCKEQLQQATEDLQKATEQVGQRLNDLETLQKELANMADEADLYCECEDEGLDEEFKGDVEVVRLFRRFEAAKAKHREREGKPVEANEEVDSSAAMDINFEGDDFSDDDLTELGAAGEGVDADQRRARKKKLAAIVKDRCNKKLRGSNGTGVRRAHGK